MPFVKIWILISYHLCKIVNRCKLDDAGHAIAEGNENEPIQRRRVMHLGQIRPGVHGQST